MAQSAFSFVSFVDYTKIQNFDVKKAIIKIFYMPFCKIVKYLPLINTI